MLNEQLQKEYHSIVAERDVVRSHFQESERKLVELNVRRRFSVYMFTTVRQELRTKEATSPASAQSATVSQLQAESAVLAEEVCIVSNGIACLPPFLFCLLCDISAQNAKLKASVAQKDQQLATLVSTVKKWQAEIKTMQEEVQTMRAQRKTDQAEIARLRQENEQLEHS